MAPRRWWSGRRKCSSRRTPTCSTKFSSWRCGSSAAVCVPVRMRARAFTCVSLPLMTVDCASLVLLILLIAGGCRRVVCGLSVGCLRAGVPDALPGVHYRARKAQVRAGLRVGLRARRVHCMPARKVPAGCGPGGVLRLPGRAAHPVCRRGDRVHVVPVLQPIMTREWIMDKYLQISDMAV